MKAKAKLEKEKEATALAERQSAAAMGGVGEGDAEMNDERDEIEELAKREVESKKKQAASADTAFYDKVYNYLQN